jgi:uncharacterized small protein (TIGR04563 family)
MSRGLRLSLYFPADMLQEIQGEARRLRRSVSWIVQRAWKMAHADRGAPRTASAESTKDVPDPAKPPLRLP